MLRVGLMQHTDNGNNDERHMENENRQRTKTILANRIKNKTVIIFRTKTQLAFPYSQLGMTSRHNHLYMKRHRAGCGIWTFFLLNTCQ